jgi:hypothetical protein
MWGIPRLNLHSLRPMQSVVSGLNLRQCAARLLDPRQCSSCTISADGDNTKLHIVQPIHAICISSTSNRTPSMHQTLDHPIQSASYSHYGTRCAANSRLWFQARPTCSSLLQKRPTVEHIRPHSGAKRPECETDRSPPWESVDLYLRSIYMFS